MRQTMSKDANKAAIRDFTRIFKNQHNVDGIDHLFAANFRHNFKQPMKPGLEGFKDVGRMMNAAFPDVVVTEDDLIATDDTVVERSHAKATNKGSFMGAKPTNGAIAWSEIHIYRFDGTGKICEHWVEISSLELALQCGAVKVTAPSK
jgi:predicted ester cyclase